MNGAQEEERRLSALADLDILDTAPEPIFDSLTQLAMRTFSVPAALISLVDRDRQWFKACIGLPVTQTPRDVAFCDHTIRNGTVLVAPDATVDPRFANNALVTGEPGIRFYAGAPLTTPEGYCVGALSLIDFTPRLTFGRDQADQLQQMADAVMQALIMRRDAAIGAREAARVRDQNDLLELAGRLAHVGTWSWDPVANAVRWSDEAYRLHGMDPSEPMPTMAELLATHYPRDGALITEVLQRAAEGEAFNIRLRLVRRDGAVRHLVSVGACRRDDEGRVVGVYGSFQDVTELRQSEERYRLLAENARDIILQYDLEGRAVYVSPAVRQLGFSPAQILGRRVGALTHPDDLATQRGRLEDAGRGVEGGSFEVRVRRADGEWVWMESNPAPIRDEDDRIVGVFTVMRDISERKAAEAIRRGSDARYRLLADNSTDVIVTYDLQGCVSYAAPSIRRYGHRPEDMIGRPLGGATHPDDLPRVRQAFLDALAGKPSPLDAFRARDADGRWSWFEGQMTPLNDDTGRLIGVLTVNRDISARLAAEQALGEVSAELTRVARISAMGAFSASIAHEINQPLTALVTNSQTALIWLSKDPPDAPMAERAIRRGVQDALRASEIIARMRSLVTKGTSTIAEFDLNDAIREVLALTAAERLRMKVAARADVTRDPLRVRGDRIQVLQVLLNLIANAIEAMRDVAEEERRLWIRSRTTEDGQVLVEVEDRGGGLDPATADQVFEHLFTTKTGGTGLGLSISRSIIESHGGRIWAEPAATSGAVFRFLLPRSEPADHAAAEAADPADG